MDKEKIIKQLWSIETEAADVYRVGMILQLISYGMDGISESQSQHQPFTVSNIGDVFSIFYDVLERKSDAIKEIAGEIESTLRHMN